MSAVGAPGLVLSRGGAAMNGDFVWRSDGQRSRRAWVGGVQGQGRDGRRVGVEGWG